MIWRDARMAFFRPAHRGWGCRDAEYKVKNKLTTKRMRMSHKRVSPQQRDNKDMEAISTEVMEAVKRNLQQERVTKPFVIFQLKDRPQ